MVHVLVTMHVKEGRMAEFLAAVKEARPFVLKEPGCLAYDFTRETASPLGIQEPIDENRITLIERWESMDALNVHAQPAAQPDPRRQELAETMRSLRESVVARVTVPAF